MSEAAEAEARSGGRVGVGGVGWGAPQRCLCLWCPPPSPCVRVPCRAALRPPPLRRHCLLRRRLKPDYADAHCDLGCTYCAQVGGFGGELLVWPPLRSAPHNHYRSLAPLPPPPPPPPVATDTAIKQGDVDNAKKCFKQAIQCAPHHLEAHFNMGNLYRQCAEFGRAIQRCARSQAGAGAALDTAGWGGGWGACRAGSILSPC